MTEQAEPDWDLLPDQPRAFFGLADVFDRTDLKRAYNRWVRRFKPERAPAEFQRIRAAYEHLDELLRYGIREEAGFGTAGVDLPAADARPEATPEAPAAAPAYPTAERLRELAPDEVLRELTAYGEKSPANWVHQALLTDELAADNPLALFDVLIEGVRATRGAPAVVHVLNEACREELLVGAASKLVQRLLELCAGPGRPSGFHPSWYYFATESLWCELIERAPFDGVRALLARCRERLGEAGHDAYLILLFRLLRRGLFRADPDWIDESWEELETRYSDLPPWLQEELDLFQWLDRYRPLRAEFVAGHPFRAHVDAALRRIVAGDEVAADREFLALQVQALDRPRELAEAFPFGDEELDAVLGPLFWYADQVADRRGEEETEFTPQLAHRRVQEFLYRIERTTDGSLLGRVWNLVHFLLLALLFVLFAAPLFVCAVLKGTPQLVVLGLLVPYYLLLWLAWRRRWIGRVMDAATDPIEDRIYARHWRAETQDFLASTLMPWGVLLETLRDFKESSVTNDKFLFAYLLRDPGMALGAQALRFAE